MWNFTGDIPFEIHQDQNFLQLTLYVLHVEGFLEANKVSKILAEYPLLANACHSTPRLLIGTALDKDGVWVPELEGLV